MRSQYAYDSLPWWNQPPENLSRTYFPHRMDKSYTHIEITKSFKVKTPHPQQQYVGPLVGQTAYNRISLLLSLKMNV
jgi:hypothetical protein